MADPSNSPDKPKFSAEIIKERLQTMTAWLEQVESFVGALDWLGAAEEQAAGSDEQELVNVRDEVDFDLSHFLRAASHVQRVRAETTHCDDLLMDAAVDRQGDGADALHLMRRFHELEGDETDGGEPPPETLPDFFAWDIYLRVSALPGLVEQFPKHLRHSARQMHGWPMIVSHHLDCRPEFERVAEDLGIGADYPPDAGPRKKRGAETPLLRYLEPLVWRLHVGRKLLKGADDEEHFNWLVKCVRADFRGPEPKPEILAILKLVPALPPLSQKTAREWSRKVIVPLITIDDAATPKSCAIPALHNIWEHRSVKSRAAFQSRLHSAVTDTLQRFGRPG